MLVDTKYKKLGDYTELESVAIDETGSASNTILPAPPAGKQNLIYKIWFVTTVDTTIQFKDGATDLTGAIDLPSGGSVNDSETGGFALEEGTDFKIRVDSVSANNTRISAKIEYLEINETII